MSYLFKFRTVNDGSIKSVGMTTNGIILRDKLNSLVEAGLTSVNISLDTLREDRFATITRRKGLMRVLSSIYSSISKGLHVKVNCVVVR